MKKYAVIVAGGSGQRMGASEPKQFLDLAGKPVLLYTLDCFLQAYTDLQIILVLPAAFQQQGSALIQQLPQANRIQITVGGETRFHSVQNGLQLVTEPSVIWVHDAVRCLVSSELIQACYEQALHKGSAIPAVAATDSIRIQTGETHQVADRKQVRIIQTPQTFLSNILLPAFKQSYREDFTDEATVVEATGQPVFLIEGSYDNIKITRPVDLLIAASILSAKQSKEV